MTEQCAGKIYG